MSHQHSAQIVSSTRRIAKLGFLAALLSAGVMELISFAVFGCPCIPDQTVVPDHSIRERPPEWLTKPDTIPKKA